MAGLKVEVVCAQRSRQQVVALVVEEGASAVDAVRASGLIPIDRVADENPLHLGIYGKSVSPDAILRDGDRVEIYRPLKIDPKTARRTEVARKSRRTR